MLLRAIQERFPAVQRALPGSDGPTAPAALAARTETSRDNGMVPADFAPPSVAPGLAAAYAHCKAVTRAYGTTYYFSTRFFPEHLRPSVYALYAWVRYPDEWVDNPGTLTLDEQCARLRAWRRATEQAIATGESDHPVLLAWANAAREFNVPLSYMRDFLSAMEMDLTVARYQTFDDLQRYTWGSASVVGLMMCSIIGATDPRAIAPAADLGLAMQLTNFLRDVGDDWRSRGRLYLPLEDLAEFGVREDDIAEQNLSYGFRKLVRFEARRAREYYRRSDDGVAYIPRESRLPIRLARVLYSRILDKIEANNCDVLTVRNRVPNREKLVVLAQEWRRTKRSK